MKLYRYDYVLQRADGSSVRHSAVWCRDLKTAKEDVGRIARHLGSYGDWKVVDVKFVDVPPIEEDGDYLDHLHRE